MIDMQNKVLVTNHPSLVQYLLELNLITKGTKVIKRATENDVLNKDVIGVLPLPLAALAKSVTYVPVKSPPNLRGNSHPLRDLTIEEVRKYSEKPKRFEVKEILFG